MEQQQHTQQMLTPGEVGHIFFCQKCFLSKAGKSKVPGRGGSSATWGMDNVLPAGVSPVYSSTQSTTENGVTTTGSPANGHRIPTDGYTVEIDYLPMRHKQHDPQTNKIALGSFWHDTRSISSTSTMHNGPLHSVLQIAGVGKAYCTYFVTGVKNHENIHNLGRWKCFWDSGFQSHKNRSTTSLFST